VGGKKGVKSDLDFTVNRREFMSRIGPSVAIIPANRLQTRNGDVHHPFRQDSDFYFLTGIVEPDGVCILAPSRKLGKFVLFVNPKDPLTELWTGTQMGIEGVKKITGADEVYAISEFDSIIPELLKGSERLFYKFGKYPDWDRKLNGWINSARKMGARRDGWALKSVEDPEKILGDMRLKKSAPELERLRAAIEITKNAHIRAMAFTKPGVFEYELEAELLHEFRRNGSQRVGYEPIVGAGKNATTLHYIENDSEILNGDLVLIDAGCEVDYYTADITRTYPANGSFSESQRNLYNVILEANEAAIAMVKPGESLDAIHKKTCEILFEGYAKLGLFPGEDALWASDHVKEYYPHNTSHWLGMDVHDLGTYRDEKGEPRVLEPGMVFTIEPGVYVREEGLGKRQEWTPYLGIGIRIEDNILVTEDGFENLSGNIPKKPEELEKIIGSSTDV